jgi:hypothetical protein
MFFFFFPGFKPRSDFFFLATHIYGSRQRKDSLSLIIHALLIFSRTNFVPWQDCLINFHFLFVHICSSKQDLNFFFSLLLRVHKRKEAAATFTWEMWMQFIACKEVVFELWDRKAVSSVLYSEPFLTSNKRAARQPRYTSVTTYPARADRAKWHGLSFW